MSVILDSREHVEQCLKVVGKPSNSTFFKNCCPFLGHVLRSGKLEISRIQLQKRSWCQRWVRNLCVVDMSLVRWDVSMFPRSNCAWNILKHVDSFVYLDVWADLCHTLRQNEQHLRAVEASRSLCAAQCGSMPTEVGQAWGCQGRQAALLVATMLRRVSRSFKWLDVKDQESGCWHSEAPKNDTPETADEWHWMNLLANCTMLRLASFYTREFAFKSRNWIEWIGFDYIKYRSTVSKR